VTAVRDFIRSVTWPQLSVVISGFVTVLAIAGWAADDARSGAWFSCTMDVASAFGVGLGCAVLVRRDRRRARRSEYPEGRRAP
jgi:hypothetical protein